MKKCRAFCLILSLTLAGCLQESPEELARLTKEDPVFKQMILSRDQAHAQSRLIKEDLLERKKTMDDQIGKLRSDYDVIAKQQNKKMDQYGASIEQNANRLRKEIEAQSQSQSEKEVIFGSDQRKLAEVRKILQESKGFKLTKTERQQWEERALLLTEKMRPLAEEIQDLKLQIRLKKQKIRYLR